jgi:hypothetical protein
LGCTVRLEEGDIEVAATEIVLASEGPSNLRCLWEQRTFVAIDTALTRDLEQEGIARDFKRLIQDQAHTEP